MSDSDLTQGHAGQQARRGRYGAGCLAGSSPGGQRWLLVAAGLLLQFSIGAVYAWSVFGGALEKAEPWQLSKVRAALPFEVTIGMIFIGSYVGGRLQDARGPRIVALIGGVIYAVGILMASFTNGEERLLAAHPGLRRGQRLRPRVRLHRADRDAAEVVPRQEGAHHRPGRGRLRLRCRADLPGRAVADRPRPRRPDQCVPAARHRLPRHVAHRRLVLPQPAAGLRRAGLRAGERRGRRLGGAARTTPRARRCAPASGTSSPRSSPSASAPASR